MPRRQALKMMHMAPKTSAKNSSKLNKFLHSEVNQLIQHIIVQHHDGQNKNTSRFIILIIIIHTEWNLERAQAYQPLT
jgi:hypothetical protein